MTRYECKKCRRPCGVWHRDDGKFKDGTPAIATFSVCCGEPVLFIPFSS